MAIYNIVLISQAPFLTSLQIKVYAWMSSDTKLTQSRFVSLFLFPLIV